MDIFFSAFKMIEGNRATLQCGVYLISNVLAITLAVYKCQVMGLLPTHPSDWLAFVEPQKVSSFLDVFQFYNFGVLAQQYMYIFCTCM